MSDNEITSFIATLKVFDPNIDTMIAKKDLSKFPKFKEFFDSHCVSRTYYFQVKKCLDSQCKFHRPRQLLQEIERIPNPIPYTDKDVQPHPWPTLRYGRVCWFHGRKISRPIFRVLQVDNHLTTYTVGEQTFILEEFACCQQLQSQI